MSSNPVPKPFEGFKRLGTSTYLYQPPTPSSTKKPGESTNPALILLCPWLDALPKHIAKYTEGYKVLYPNARILLVTTSFREMSFYGTKGTLARLEPAIQVLLSVSGPPDQQILHEFFSNGGAQTSNNIARECIARTGRQLPIGAQISDSSPGEWHYGRLMTALEMSLPKQFVLRWLGLIFLHLYISWLVIARTIMRKEDVITVIGRRLNDKALFDQRAPRLYIYSREDKMVFWEDVKRHAKAAEVKGYKVTEEEFMGSAHCAHMMKDPKRYWGAISDLWAANTLGRHNESDGSVKFRSNKR